MDELSNLAAKSIVDEFELSVSRPRFNRYLREHPNKLDAVAVYLWNLSLCSALYPVLQCLEVTYRNALDAALKSHRGDRWYDDQTLLLPNEWNKAQSVKNSLTQQGKSNDPGRVVAELSFGFWVALYSSPYVARVVHSTLRSVFPNAPKHMRKQQIIVDRLQEVRKLRNRIFHHEPIWHWTQAQSGPSGRAALMTQYEDILLLTVWIGTGQSKVVHSIDRFRQVHDEGWLPLRAKVDELVLEKETILEAAQQLGARNPR